MNDISTAFLDRWLGPLGRGPVSGFVPLDCGANSRVYRVMLGDSSVLVKRYGPQPPDRRDRLTTEFETLGFLWQQGMRNVPQPLCAAPEERLAAYSFMEGVKIGPQEIDLVAIRKACRFLSDLQGLRRSAAETNVGPASEACFSIDEHCDVFERRLAALRASVRRHAEARQLVEGELVCEWQAARERIRRRAHDLGMDPSQELPVQHRVLSPSDFGFHNMLVDPDGELVFVDFEYFGWDDAAKTIVDFLLHPAHPLPAHLHAGAVEELQRALATGDPWLEERWRLLYPLLGLKWVVILMNSFMRESSPAVLESQLEKARIKLEQVRSAVHLSSPLSL